MEPSTVAAVGLGGSAGGVLLGLIVSKLLNRTAASVAELPVLEYRVKHLEEKVSAQAEMIQDHETQLAAVWREFGKAKSWIETAVELARAKGLELSTPRWGKEP